MIRLPEGAAEIIRRLEAAGFTAWAVGGCVRDALRGEIPNDWDIASSARPEQTMEALAGLRVRPTGLQHGTVTVVLPDGSYEVTTYRTECGYTDGRHPDAVCFVDRIEQDLARRDFTMNAMAWHPERGLCDPFGGRQDMAVRCIRAVGDPVCRFTEDALRILRGLRFAARTGYTIDPATQWGMWRCAPLLHRIAAERVREELLGLLTGRYAGRVLREQTPILAEVLPELAPMFGHGQHNPHHCFDVWEHTVRAVEQAPGEDAVFRLAVLLHDCGKPACYSLDEQGIGHFYGHPAAGAAIAETLLERLRCSREDTARVLALVQYHDYPLGNDLRLVRRRLAKFGEPLFRQLLLMKKCDCVGQQTHAVHLAELSETEQLLNRAVEEKLCCSVHQLAVRGDALAQIGLQGPAIGHMLQRLLDCVIEGETENTEEALLQWAKRHREE